LRKLALLFASFCIIFAAGTAGAQQLDVAFGVGTVTGTSASDVSAADFASGAHIPQTISGGAYPAFSGDLLFYKKYFGVGGEIAWRANQNVNIFGQPYRPVLWDFNAVFGPPLGKRAQAEIQGGIGAESVRFYTPFVTCSGSVFVTCTDYQTSNHFMGHVGGGIRFYMTRSIFIRPEAHFYFVHNNVEFAGPRVNRFGVSIGYSRKSQF
jgi:hypothetical protein